MGWTDADGRPVEVPDPPPAGSHYAAIGAFQGASYHRNAFAQGTGQEVEVLADVLDIAEEDLLLDVGCGNGRHVAAFAARGVRAVGLDVSAPVLAGGDFDPTGAVPRRVVCGDSGALPFPDGAFDAVMSVCQGGFGLSASADARAMAEWHRVLRPGGRVALTAFSLVFAARFLGPGEAIDVDRGMHHHLAEVRGPDGESRRFDLWTAAYTPAHLRLVLSSAGFDVLGAAGVDPGAYQASRPPTLGDPELLMWARRR